MSNQDLSRENEMKTNWNHETINFFSFFTDTLSNYGEMEIIILRNKKHILTESSVQFKADLNMFVSTLQSVSTLYNCQCGTVHTLEIVQKNLELIISFSYEPRLKNKDE